MFCLPLNGVEGVEFEDILNTIQDINKLSDEQLKRLCELKSIIERRKLNNPILYYKPQKHQLPFHSSLKKLRLISGSNQSGKTMSSCAEGIMLSLGIHPFRKMQVPNKGRVIGTDLQKGIGEVIQAKYEELLPKCEIDRIFRYPGGEFKKIRYKNGSQVEFMSYEQDTQSFEGWVGDWVQFDEPPPRDKYIACMRGLMKRKGICWLALTPLTEPWIYDEIYTQGGTSLEQPDVFTFDILDNKYLSIEQVKDFESRLTEDEKEARLHGRFMHLSGLIYKEFKPAIHVIDDFEIPDSWVRYCSMDYHPRTPCAVLWLAVSPQQRFYVYDELWINETIGKISEAIKAKEAKHKIKARMIDPLSSTPDRKEAGSCALREFLKEGLAFRPANKKFDVGKNLICELLKLDKEGKPGIYFLRNSSVRTIHAMTHYQWDEYANSEVVGEKETPKKKYAHFPDCLRYIVISRPKYITQEMAEIGELIQEGKKHRFTGYGG